MEGMDLAKVHAFGHEEPDGVFAPRGPFPMLSFLGMGVPAEGAKPSLVSVPERSDSTKDRRKTRLGK